MTRVRLVVAIGVRVAVSVGLLLSGCGPGKVRPADGDQRGSADTGEAGKTDGADDTAIGDRGASRPDGPVEVAVRGIPLAGAAGERSAELSGLAWCGDSLILLPQYPERFGAGRDGVGAGQGGAGALLAVDRAVLAAAIDGVMAGVAVEPIAPRAVELVAPGLLDAIPGAQGFEAIAFWGRRAFLTVEASGDGRMVGYLVAGEMAADGSRLTLDVASRAEIPARAWVGNASEEALVVTRDRVVTVYEANGRNVNTAPVGHVFDHDLRPLGTLPFPAVEYRVIDATALDADGRFWLSNYFYVGDRERYDPAPDPIAAAHGRGPGHREGGTVERLLQARLGPSGITLVDAPPIWLELGDRGRNWEGLARWGDHGFVMVTDTFPDTLLGYLPGPYVAPGAR